MNKKIKIAIILTVIFLIIGGILLFNKKNLEIDSLNKTIPQITGDERIDRIIFNSHHAKVLREARGPSILNEGSLINLVHIIKEESDYKISCEFGPAYETANLNKFYPEELVSMGQIKGCTIETAEAIDGAIKSLAEVDCRVPITSPYSPHAVLSLLEDYYLVTLKTENNEITQELVNSTQGRKCFEPLENLLGEDIAIGFIVAIIDIEENRVYY